MPWTTRCVAGLIVLAAVVCLGAERFESGLKPGQRPGPYSSLVSVGPRRGQSHCFICETADRPAVIVFARTLSDALAKLVRGLDRALVEQKGTELRAWVTLLSDDQTALDPKVVEWSKQQSVRNVSLSIFEDVLGPPSYLLQRDADVTVLLAIKQRVIRKITF